MQAFGLWLAGLAIGVKVILAAFAASAWHMPQSFDPANPFMQIICTGSSFLVLDENGETIPDAPVLPLCPLCINAAPIILGAEPDLTARVILFILALALILGLDRPRQLQPVGSSFSSRAPPFRTL